MWFLNKPKPKPPCRETRQGGFFAPLAAGRAGQCAPDRLPLIGEAIGMHPVGAGLCSYNLPRKKVTSIWISNVPSIDGRYSTATGCKFGTPVSGGAYQDARKVSIEWNARLKHRRSPEFRCRMHQTVTQRPFSPPSFPARRKRRGRRRRVRNDHDGTSRRKRRLLSSVLVSSFPNRKLNLRFGFSYANLIQPLSLGCAEPASLPLLSLRDISP